jgi:hypothetical protein
MMIMIIRGWNSDIVIMDLLDFIGFTPTLLFNHGFIGYCLST